MRYLQHGRAFRPEYAAHRVARELVVTGRNRCVGGEDTPPAYGLEIRLGRRTKLSPLDLALEQCQAQQRRVTLVHVEGGDLGVPQAFQDPHATHSQDGFLAEPVVVVAAI